jgi:hypothetical protein
MNKSPLYLLLLRFFLLFIGGLSALVNTSLTASAAHADHYLGNNVWIGLGMILALILTGVEAVFGHVLSSFVAARDLIDQVVSTWLSGRGARIWLMLIGPLMLAALAQVYRIDTSTTYWALSQAGLPPDWAITFSLILVFSFEVCLITARWVERQRKVALRQSLEESTNVDPDIEYHKARRKAKIKTALELGARNGYNEASERYAKTVEGR